MEIATAVGGALLSASVQPLIQRLMYREFDKSARRENIHADIKDWETMLAQINAVLDDAEDKQVTNPAVKIWLDEFRDLTYDIEDVLDEFNTEALKPKEIEDSEAITDMLWPWMPNEMASSRAFQDKMAARIHKITERLKSITEMQKTLTLTSIANGSRSNQLKESRLTTSLVDDSRISGRDVDKKAIVDELLKNEEGGNNSISVIAIWGMGGIGKTTLAQLVYNDSAVEGFFDIRAWVCVSENFDVTILTRTILLQVSPETPNLKHLDLNSLQVKLKEKLSQKKFMLVLDDVWSEDYNQWDQLRIPFISASSSSKIVVTTRKKNAAPITGDAYAYHVKELLDDECLSILARHALAVESFDAHLDLKEIGQELVKRCDGLPLAAKVLAGLLRNKRSPGEWQRVRDKLWNSLETSNSVHPILKLSYNDLPSHLKRCFVYCAIVPKDYEFDRDELVSLWMGEGFLDPPQGGTPMEDLGIEYFEELVSRSFFQSSNINHSARPFYLPGMCFWPTTSRRSVFVMHDLISDIAQSIAKDTCYNYENKSGSKYEKVRHASFSLLQDSQEYGVYSRMKNLRTIVGFPILRKHDWSYRNKDLCHKNCYEFSPQSRCLRVLSLTVCGLPKSIGDLKHLRHLNLSFSTIEQLPESVSCLLNMHTLLLHGCDSLKKLPDKTRKLLNLRHLDIAKTDQLLKLPSGIGMLTNLQTLSKFTVKEGDGAAITELKNLNNLRGSLSVEGLQNVQDAKLAILKEKQGLEELILEWDSSHHGRNDMSVLESLEPYQNLKRLTIQYYGGAEFPSWVSNMSQLVSLKLKDCEETKVLPPLGQLGSLKELVIVHLKAVETIGVEFYGNVVVPFPSLESLEFRNMSEWREWYDGNMGGEGFPKLHKLELNYCPKLKSFPRMGLPRSQKCIIVKHCDALERFPIIYTSHGEQSLLKELQIRDCASLQCFETNFRLPTSLLILIIHCCGNLLSLPDGLMMPDDNENQPQSHLQYLEIKGCQRLNSLPTGKFPVALKTLKIRGCSLDLKSAISEKNTALERIEIEDNDGIKVFPSIDCLKSLEHLSIDGCPALESSSEMSFLSSSLQTLEIKNCQNLSLPPIRTQSQFPSLRELRIAVGITNLVGPGSITSLEMNKCDNLKQPIAEWGLGMLSSLEIIVVFGRCPATADMESFPDDDCCWLPTSLKVLTIIDFINLESVSVGLQKLTSLRALRIKDCPKLLSLPREALPTSLEELSIYGRCAATVDMVSFPDENCCWLPTSLKVLHIGDFINLEYVSVGLQKLTSLQALHIIDCPKLRSLPGEARPLSLREFYISGCPLLKEPFSTGQMG